MEAKVQILSIAVTAGLLGLVFELVRRRRLMERYALLWLFAASVLLALAVWRDLLETIAGAVGIYYAPSALFAIAFGFILVLLLHFSLVISRLADQSKVLAQRLGIVQQQLDELRDERAGRAGDSERAGRARDERAGRALDERAGRAPDERAGRPGDDERAGDSERAGRARDGRAGRARDSAEVGEPRSESELLA